MLIANNYIAEFESEIDGNLSEENVFEFLKFSLEAAMEKKAKQKYPLQGWLSKKYVYVLDFVSLEPIQFKIAKVYRDENIKTTEEYMTSYVMDGDFFRGNIYKNLLIARQSYAKQFSTFRRKNSVVETNSGTKLLIIGEEYLKQIEKFSKGKSLDDYTYSEYDAALEEFLTTVENSISEKEFAKSVFYVNLESLESIVDLGTAKRFVEKEFLTNEETASLKWVGNEVPAADFREWTDNVFLLEGLYFIYRKGFARKMDHVIESLKESDLFALASKNYLVPTNEKPTLKVNRLLLEKDAQMDIPKDQFLDFFILALERKHVTLIDSRIELGLPGEVSCNGDATSLKKVLKISNTSNQSFGLDELEIKHTVADTYYGNYFYKQWVIVQKEIEKMKEQKVKDASSKDVMTFISNLEEELQFSNENAASLESFHNIMFGTFKNNILFKEPKRYIEIGPYLKKRVLPHLGDVILSAYLKNSQLHESVIRRNLQELPQLLYIFEKDDNQRITLQEAMMGDFTWETIIDENNAFNKEQTIFSLGVVCSLIKTKMTNAKQFEMQLLKNGDFESILNSVTSKSFHISNLDNYTQREVSILLNKIINAKVNSIVDGNRLTNHEKFLFLSGLYFKKAFVKRENQGDLDNAKEK